MFSVYVCVFGIYVLKIVVERWFWELKMFIGSLIELHAWLHSYLYFSLLEKLFLSNLDTSSTPGYLSRFSTSSYRNLDSFTTARWIDRDFFWTLNNFSIAGGSIELLFRFLLICPSTDPRQLHLSTPFCSTLVLTPFDTSIYQDLLGSYLSANHFLLIFLDLSLDRLVFSPPKTLSLTPNLIPKCSLSFFLSQSRHILDS